MKPHLLVICSQGVIPAMNGGDLRTLNLALGLTEWFEVTAIVAQYPEVIESALNAQPAYSKIRFVSTFRHPANNHAASRNPWQRWMHSRDVSIWKHWRHMNYDWTFAPNYLYCPIMIHECRERKPDAILIEHTHLAATAEFAARCWPGIVRVVNSHNVESHLIRQIFPAHHSEHLRDHYLRAIEGFERRLPDWCDLLWACSEEDLRLYAGLGVRGLTTRVIANGVDTDYFSMPESNHETPPPVISFCGSLSYAPNQEGLLWFHEKVWPHIVGRVPNVRCSIVGSLPVPLIEALAQSDPRIEVHGNVPDVRPYLRQATVSICPLHRGSGTRLKILTSFSAGLPTVSTRLGAEGLQVVPGGHLLLADDPVEFAQAVIRLLQDHVLREKIRAQARQLAEQVYDWRVISRAAAEHLLERLAAAPRLKASRQKTPKTRNIAVDRDQRPACAIGP